MILPEVPQEIVVVIMAKEEKDEILQHHLNTKDLDQEASVEENKEEAVERKITEEIGNVKEKVFIEVEKETVREKEKVTEIKKEIVSMIKADLRNIITEAEVLMEEIKNTEMILGIKEDETKVFMKRSINPFDSRMESTS